MSTKRVTIHLVEKHSNGVLMAPTSVHLSSGRSREPRERLWARFTCERYATRLDKHERGMRVKREKQTGKKTNRNGRRIRRAAMLQDGGGARVSMAGIKYSTTASGQCAHPDLASDATNGDERTMRKRTSPNK